MSDLDRRLASLAGEDEWTRQRTLEELRTAGLTPQEVDDLGTCLAHESATVRASARMALAAVAGPGSASRSAAQAQLRAELASEEERVRVLAASALGEAGDPEAGPALVAALSDPSSNVAAAAADSLGQLCYGPALESLAELSETEDFWVRAAAVVALGRLGDERAVPVLGRLARTAGLEKPIAEALRRIDHPSVLDVLPHIHRTAPEEALRVAGAILTAHPDLEAPEWVAAAAREEEEALRYSLIQEDDPAIARLVGLAASPESVECLVDLLGPPRWSEAAIAGLLAVPAEARADGILRRVDAAEDRELVTLLSLLPPLSDRDQIRRLVPLLRHERESVRGAAAEALARAPMTEALPLLAAEMGQDRVAPEVVRALGGIGEAACASLLPLLRDPSAPVRSAAASALVRCAGPELGGELRSALEREEDEDARASLVRALARAAGAGAMDVLDEALESPREETRLAAIEALGWVGDPAAIPRLEEALGGSRAERLAAIRSLGELAVPEGAPVLQPCLTSDDLAVRQAAAREAVTLAEVLDSEALERLADDEDGWIRTCAARALGRRGESGRQRLEIMVEQDPDPDVRSAARRALGQVD